MSVGPHQHSPGDPHSDEEGLKPVHRILQVAELIPRSVYLLPHADVGEILPGAFCI